MNELLVKLTIFIDSNIITIARYYTFKIKIKMLISDILVFNTETYLLSGIWSIFFALKYKQIKSLSRLLTIVNQFSIIHVHKDKLVLRVFYFEEC